MPDKSGFMHDPVNKKDLELILEVNKKAIEIETEVVDQNEEIIKLLTENKSAHEKIDEKIDQLIIWSTKHSEDQLKNSKDLFKIQVLFVSGLLSLAIQVFEIFFKK